LSRQIAAWTTPSLAFEALAADGEPVPEELIAHLSPVAWEPVNFRGPSTVESRRRAAAWRSSSNCELALTKRRKLHSGGFCFDLDPHEQVLRQDQRRAGGAVSSYSIVPIDSSMLRMLAPQ
jgi:hypothetical protein